MVNVLYGLRERKHYKNNQGIYQMIGALFIQKNIKETNHEQKVISIVG